MNKNLSASVLFVLLLNTAFASTAYAGLFGSTHEAQNFAVQSTKWFPKAAEALKELDAAYGLKTLEFTSGPAREFVANSLEFFAKKEDWAKFWSTIGNTEQSAIKGDKIMQKLTTELNGKEAAKTAMSKLMNSEYGKKAFGTWSEEAVEGLVKAADKGYLGIAERISTKYGDDMAEIEGKGISRGTIETSDEMMYRLADYTKAVRKLGVNDPLEDIGIHQLKKMYRASGSGTVTFVGNEPIKNVGIIKKGEHYFDQVKNEWKGFGHEHFIGARQPFSTSRIEDVKNVFKLKTDDEAFDLIGEAFEKGSKSIEDPNTIIYTKTIAGKDKTIRLITDGKGSLTTVVPRE
ncbi:MAG TPA: hypothetical protein HA254_04915 [Candidatus Diapherotrites archaeon]|uniref:Uncharacterized protein n=1 Tax=Candidatus Iainarchaeum sp. TaxID=3101447 RepID=A0A7J4IYR3_9ARCH|nr:hypothetical protein [Candidatus Diapherotrites archaeon]